MAAMMIVIMMMIMLTMTMIMLIMMMIMMIMMIMMSIRVTREAFLLKEALRLDGKVMHNVPDQIE